MRLRENKNSDANWEIVKNSNRDLGKVSFSLISVTDPANQQRRYSRSSGSHGSGSTSPCCLPGSQKDLHGSGHLCRGRGQDHRARHVRLLYTGLSEEAVGIQGLPGVLLMPQSRTLELCLTS